MTTAALTIRWHLRLGLVTIALPATALCAKGDDRTGEHAHFAVAVNPAHVGYFIVAGERGAGTARKKVLKRCRTATGPGCELLMASQGGFLALGYSPSGNLRIVVESTRERATGAFDEDCNAEYGGTCALERIVDLSSRSEISEASEPRRFAAVAFGAADDGSGQQDGRVWLVSGRATADEAIAAAMQRCGATLGAGNCRTQVTSGQTHIALYRSPDGRSGGMQINLSQQLSIAAVERACKQDGIRCEIIALAAARDERDQEYDLNRMKGVPL
mgnify:FL=1